MALISGVAVLLAFGMSSCSDDGTALASPSGSPHTITARRTSPVPTGGATTSSTAPHTSSSRQSSASPSTTPPTATAVKAFTPFDDTGSPSIPITTARTGHCWTGSIALSAPKTYRCMAHNLILDPCFASSSHAGSVVCVEAPWKPGTTLKLNRPLPSLPSTGTTQSAWAIALTNGTKCVAITGMVQFVDDVPMRYTCGRGQAGDLRHHGSPWTVAYAPPHATTTHRVGVATAWR